MEISGKSFSWSHLYDEGISHNLMSQMGSRMTYIDLLKNIWDMIYNPKVNVIETIEKYFHKDYTQCINGVSMNRDEYTQHVLAQKQNMIIDAIDYKHFLEKGEELFAIYYPKGRNMENLPLEAEVIAYFHFENQQILRIKGQVRLITGDLTDVDMQRKV